MKATVMHWMAYRKPTYVTWLLPVVAFISLYVLWLS